MTNLSDPKFTNADAARLHLEAIRWPDGPVCPHCGTLEKASRIEGGRKGLLFCNACRKQYSVTVGTVFERSKVPLHKWLLANHLIVSSKKGISSHQLHRMLGVTYKTAWFMAHRIREAMTDSADPGPMGGKGKVIEADETYIGHANYVFTKRGWKPKPGPGAKYKIVSLVERGGSVRSFKVDKVNSRTVREVVLRNASRHSVLSTDEAAYYKRLGKEFARHWTVNHSKGQYGHGMAHTNTIEGFFSIFKRGMKGVYQHCGEQHLQRYLAEFDFRYNNRVALGVDDDLRADVALKGAEGKRLTYRRANDAA